MSFISRNILPVSFSIFFTQITFSQGILLNDEALRSDLNWLNQQGVIQISTSTWPLSGDEVQRAIENAQISNTSQQNILTAVQNKLSSAQQSVKLGLSAESTQKDLPQNFGDATKAQYQAQLEFNAGGEHWDGKLRINAEHDQQIHNDQKVNLEGSYLAGKFWNQWLIAGQIPTYWGPGHDGSLARGDASRPVYGVTMQRAEQSAFQHPWLSWVGPWQYQVFAGQLDDYQAIPHTKLIGMRLTAQPWNFLELGASRMLQWGGDGRSQSIDSLWDALIGQDNVYGDTENPSNQIAGFDARFNLQPLFNVPVGFYGQYVGEDEAGLMPAKKMYLVGLDYSSSIAQKPYQLYAEWVDTRTNGHVRGISYNHSVYRDGYYQHGFPLGHAIGGDGQMISTGGNIHLDPRNRLNGRVLFAKLNQSERSTNRAFPQQDELKAIDLTWTHQLRPHVDVKMNAWLSDSDRQGQDGGASIGVELPLFSR